MLYYIENFSFIAEKICCESYKIVARILQVNFNKKTRDWILYDILSIGRVIFEQTQNLVSFWTFTGPLVQNWETLENFFLEQPYMLTNKADKIEKKSLSFEQIVLAKH